MSNLYWLTEARMQRLGPYFPKSRGRARVDDRRVLSGIIFINRNGLRWCDAPAEYRPPKVLYNPRSQVALKDRQERQAPQPHRKDVWQAERLATYLNPLRQIPNRLLLCNCSRRSRHLLVISPDPKCCIEQRYLIIEENHGLGPLNRGFSYCIDESFDGV